MVLYEKTIYTSLTLILNSDEKMKIGKGAIKFASLTFFLLFLATIFYLLPLALTQSDEKYTVSTANITKHVAIAMSNNLTAGIIFGNVNTGTTNNNATGNFNSTGHTQYWITIDGTTNVDVDLCIRVNQSLTSGSYQIPNTNYHYSFDDDTNDWTHPAFPPTTDISETYQKTVEDKWVGGVSDEIYFRFALDVPSNTHAGDYSNYVYFKAVENTTPC